MFGRGSKPDTLAWHQVQVFSKLPVSSKGCYQKVVGDLTVTSTREADYTPKYRSLLRTMFSTD